MNNESPHPQAESNVRDEPPARRTDALARRELLIGSAAFSAAILAGPVLAAPDASSMLGDGFRKRWRCQAIRALRKLI
jgi:hypothetical protein